MDTKIISLCEEIGEKFSSKKIAQSVADAKRRMVATQKTSVLFIGNKLFQVNELLETVLGVSILSGVDVRFTEKAYRIHLVNETNQIPIKKRKFFLGEDPKEVSLDEIVHVINDSGNEKILLTVGIPDDRLNDIGIDIIINSASNKEFNWKEEFSKEDYVFFMTNAIAALPLGEKQFISEYVIPLLGHGRLAAVLLGMDKLHSEEDRNAVIQFVGNYYASIKSECEIYLGDEDKLNSFIFNDLLLRSKELKEIMEQQAIKYCYDETLEELNEIAMNSDSDIESLEHIVKDLEGKRNDMKLKGEIAALEAKRAMRNTLIEELGTLQKFSQQIVDNIQKVLDKADDLEAVKQNIPNYLQKAWEGFPLQFNESIQKKSKLVLDSAFENLKEDLKEFITNTSGLNNSEGVEKILNGIQFNGRRVMFDSSESDFKVKINKISKILMIGAIPATLFIGLPAGLIALGGSFAINPLFHEKINANTKENAIKEVQKSCLKISENYKGDITSQIENLADETEKIILDAYNQVVSEIVNAVNEKIEISKIANNNRGEIKNAINELSEKMIS